MTCGFRLMQTLVLAFACGEGSKLARDGAMMRDGLGDCLSLVSLAVALAINTAGIIHGDQIVQLNLNNSLYHLTSGLLTGSAIKSVGGLITNFRRCVTLGNSFFRDATA
jgi:hypothetical protein